MTFNDEDVVKNAVIPLEQVRVGATSDGRWRDIDDDCDRIDRARAHEEHLRLRVT